MEIEDYEHFVGRQPSIVDQLAMPNAEDVEFEPPRLRGPFARPSDRFVHP